MQYADTASEEAMAINAEGSEWKSNVSQGSGWSKLVEDQAFWEERGVHTGYDLQFYLARAAYSDAYKEANGFRPQMRDFKTPDEAWEAVDALYDSMGYDMDDDDDPYYQEEYPEEPVEPEEPTPEFFGIDSRPRKAGMHGKFAETIVVKVSDVRRIVREVLTRD